MFGAIEEEGHYGERNPATDKNDTCKQHEFARDGTYFGTLYQFGETRYCHRIDRDLAVVSKCLYAQDRYVIAA